MHSSTRARQGVQVIATALSAEQMAAIQLDDIYVQGEFAGGIIATGSVGTAFVTLGDRTTPVAIPIIVYRRFSCAAFSPCAQNDMTAGSMAQGLFNGFAAIVGASLSNGMFSEGVGSPIPQLPGRPSFIVEAPAYGTDATGTLRIGPSADEVAQYATFQLPPLAGGSPLSNGTPAWDDSAIAACVDDRTEGIDYCANATLDTGAVFTIIYLTTQTTLGVLASGDTVAVTVGPMGDPIAHFQVVVSANPQPGQDFFAVTPPLSGLGDSLNLGLTVFFRDDVYFNPVAGQVGLRAP